MKGSLKLHVEMKFQMIRQIKIHSEFVIKPAWWDRYLIKRK